MMCLMEKYQDNGRNRLYIMELSELARYSGSGSGRLGAFPMMPFPGEHPNDGGSCVHGSSGLESVLEPHWRVGWNRGFSDTRGRREVGVVSAMPRRAPDGTVR